MQGPGSAGIIVGMRIAVTGASGLIGSALVPLLERDGHLVVRLVRRQPTSPAEIPWDPAARRLDPAHLAGVDAVIHLAGAGIGDKRWNAARKAEILNSRVDGTTTVATAVAAADNGPATLISASAIGWYGDTGDRAVDESQPAGTGFLAETCLAWEAATAPASEAGVRVATMRTGLVLSREGGLLKRLIPLFKAGLGGKVSSGRMWWSWITLQDEVDAIRYLLNHDSIAGPVNVVAPNPVTNAEFTKALAAALHRPAVFRAPSLGLRAWLGEFADEGVLVGQRVIPRVLSDAGFPWSHPDLDSGLTWAITHP